MNEIVRAAAFEHLNGTGHQALPDLPDRDVLLFRRQQIQKLAAVSGDDQRGSGVVAGIARYLFPGVDQLVRTRAVDGDVTVTVERCTLDSILRWKYAASGAYILTHKSCCTRWRQ